MNIKIVSRWDSNKVLLCGEYESVKDCLGKNRDKDLSRANLSGANLSRANLSGANLSEADLSWADLSWANLSRANLWGANLLGANLLGANLSWADLSRANLSGANLSRANLSEADLSGANLGGAKNYFMSHDFCLEIIRRQPIETFTDEEWSIIGKIATHRFCWEEITKNYEGTETIFKKLAEKGYGKYLKKFKGEL